MAKARYRDFDKFFQEKGKEKVVLRLLGKEWYLPSSLPASMMLKIIRNRNAEIDNEDNVGLIFEMTKDLFGEKQYQQLLELGITVEQISAVIEWVMEIYNGTEGVTVQTEGEEPSEQSPRK